MPVVVWYVLFVVRCNVCCVLLVVGGKFFGVRWLFVVDVCLRWRVWLVMRCLLCVICCVVFVNRCDLFGVVCLLPLLLVGLSCHD